MNEAKTYTTTRSLFKQPQLDIKEQVQTQIDLCKLAMWRANMALKALKNDG